MKKLFTSESVTEGHPDKLSDYISDSILDEYLKQDSKSRVACETLCGKNLIIVSGEITSKAKVDIEDVVRKSIKDIGFNDENTGIDYKKCKVIVNISKQSEDIALGVDNSYESKLKENIEKSEGAGDQGMVFGYATNETDAYLPLPIYLAHKLSKRLADVRKNNQISYLMPDGKVQVTVEYEGDRPKRIDTIVVSAQHKENIDIEVLKFDIKDKVINNVINKDLLDRNTKYFINPTGKFVIGGPLGDTGLTGRKIIVDTYGGLCRHGGGAFSGKDATKVDRSGAYMARFIAKNIVANRLASKCEIQISYVIGVAKPVSIFVDTFGTGIMNDDEIVKIINNNFKLTPREVINKLDLEKPIYKKTTNYGHFGRNEFSWEKIINLKI